MENSKTLYIGKTLKRLRNNQKINQEEFSFLSGISREYLSKIEQDIHDPTLGKVELMAKAFGMLPSELLKEAEKDNNITK